MTASVTDELRSGLRLGVLPVTGEPARLREVRDLLAANDLLIDEDVEFFVTAHLGPELVACVGLAGSVIKCLSAAASVQGQGVAAPLMQRIFYEAVDRGRGTLFAFTKPCNRLTLESLGFTFLAEVPGAAVLLENSPFALELYLDELRALREPGDRVGAVVLHANPFTLGHLHLLRIAAKQVDVLHVFVVAEHAPGAFPAEVRLRLVREGVADAGIANIRVHRGSRYIVSRATFPNYFLAKEDTRAQAAAGLDLQLFRRHIGPALGVTDRFVGTEPLSAVTASYNVEMRRWLQEAPSDSPPIRVHEVPRVYLDGGPVSASRVRAALEAGDEETVARLVPAPTLAHLRSRFVSDRQEQ